MGAQADTIEYDFNTNPPFFAEFSDEESDYYTTGNYDFIDKYGCAVNIDGEWFKTNETGVDADWTGVTTRCIDLVDGLAYDRDAADQTHPLIVWTEKGPARVIRMGGWGTLGAWEDREKDDYMAATAEDHIATKHALAFLRSGNGGSRTETYLQVPGVVGPATVDLYIGHTGSSYVNVLEAAVIPVINGEEQEMIVAQKGEVRDDTTAKRMYKVTVDVPQEGDMKLLVGCKGSELHLYHLVINNNSASIANIIADQDNADAPVYNIMGQRVDSSYKGLVISNGVKYIQK